MRQAIRSVTLRNIWRDPKSGKAYYRSRKGGKLTLTELPDMPHDHPDFVAAWAAIHRGHAPPPVDPGSIASTWRALLASAKAREWSQTYHAKMNRHAKAICARVGTAKARAVRPEHIRADLDTAGVPADRLRAWRVWGAWCTERGMIGADPTHLVKPPKAAPTEGHPPWTAADIDAFRARWPIGTTPRALMELAYWTAARVSDLVKLGPQMVGRDGVLTFRQQKTGQPTYVPWTCPLPHYAANMDADRQLMRQAIAPFAGQLCLIPARSGKPRSSKAVSTSFQKSCADAGINVSAHGLRKARAIALIEGGATTHEAMAWTGHLTEKELAHYARKFNRRKAVMGTSQEQELDVVTEKMDVKPANRM